MEIKDITKQITPFRFAAFILMLIFAAVGFKAGDKHGQLVGEVVACDELVSKFFPALLDPVCVLSKTNQLALKLTADGLSVYFDVATGARLTDFVEK